MRFWANGSSLCLAVLLLLLATPSLVAQNPTVGSTDPNMAAQGTISLDVTINGSGYKRGAKAKWFVTGTANPGGVVVNSTSYVSSSRLIANITVAADAVISGYDVQVANSDGRTGVGVEAFTVSVGHGANACTIQPLPAGISLVGSLTGTPLATNGYFGTAIRARLATLGTRSVLLLWVGSGGSTASGKLEVFFLDPATGQLLDGQVIGSSTGQPQPHVAVSYGSAEGARVAAVGDINADAIPDFALGASIGDNLRMVYAFVSSVQDGILSYQVYSLPAPEPVDTYGWSVALGDLDGIAGDELAAGAMSQSAAPGKVFVFKFTGAGFASVQTLNNPLPNKRNDSFGRNVAIGDVAGDSRNDLIVGAPSSDLSGASGAGRVFVFPGTVSASNYLTFTTGLKNDGFGAKVAAGNVNGGFTDLIATTGVSSTDIKAHVYSGLVSQSQPASYVLRPDPALATDWGTTVAPAVADLNGDGLGDVVISAPNAACGGVVYLFLSSGGTPLATRLTVRPPAVEQDFQSFGWGFEGAPGTRLFFVGEMGSDVNGVSGAGKVYIYRLN